jgi:hypothetical protein
LVNTSNPHVHLKEEDHQGVRFVTLWGGPCRVFGRGLSNEELKELNQPFARRLDIITLELDDEDNWNIEMDISLAGVEVHAVQLDRGMRARVQLADGGWLTIAGDGTELRDSAYMLDMLLVGESHQLEDRTWKGLGMRAIAIENALPIDPYTIGDM